MMLASKQVEQYDYDNPSHSMSFDDGLPRRTGSGNDIDDAGVIRPGLINIIPDDDIPGPHFAGEDEFIDTLPPGDDDFQPTDTKKGSKIKGLFTKKKKKDKEPKEKKEKEEKEEKKSAVGGKLRGLFKRKSGPSELPPGEDLDPVVTTPESQVSGIEVANPAYDPSNPNSPPRSPYEDAPPDTMPTAFAAPPDGKQTLIKKNPFKSLLRSPPPPTPLVDDGTERLQLKPEPPASYFRCSNVLNVVLIFGIVLGILFLILGTNNKTLAIIGPAFLGLSAFALVGKIFFTLFWQEDPLPRLKPYVKEVERMMGPRKPAPPQKHVVIARSSMYGRRYGLPEDVEANLPPDQQYQDEQIDTRMRTVDEERPNAPTFI